MRAGPLRQRLDWQRNTPVADAARQLRDDWQTIRTVWGRVEPMRGAEALHARQLRPDVDTKVTTRYFADLRATDRFLFDGRPLGIAGVINIDSRNRTLEIACVEVKAGSKAVP